MSNTSTSTFDIRNFLDDLLPSTGGKYHCPVCEGNDFSVRSKDGAFKCWNNECSSREIIQVLSPGTPSDGVDFLGGDRVVRRETPERERRNKRERAKKA